MTTTPSDPESSSTTDSYAAGEMIPGQHLDLQKVPGHWLLARMGKRVLRPGGRELTWQMLDAIAVGPDDAVVEFAPGLGITARMVLEHQPASYTAIERDDIAYRRLSQTLAGPRRAFHNGTAEASGLADASATVVYGEAMLTMQPQSTKSRIAHEAYRILRPGGRYAIHELCLAPEELDDETREVILRELVETIHVGARPLLRSQWRALLEEAGFVVDQEIAAPLRLLEPGRLIQDEGLSGALRFATNVLRNPVARTRVPAIRSVFRRYQTNLAATALVATKPAPGQT